MQEVACLLLVFIGVVELIDMHHVFLLERVDDLVGALGILLVEIVGNLDEGVGGAAHGREYDEGGLARLGDEVGNVLDAFRRTNGGSAKFHYFHSLCAYVIYYTLV